MLHIVYVDLDADEFISIRKYIPARSLRHTYLELDEAFRVLEAPVKLISFICNTSLLNETMDPGGHSGIELPAPRHCRFLHH